MCLRMHSKGAKSKTHNITAIKHIYEVMKMNTKKLTKLQESLVPNCVNPSPDYYCTWQVQLYATNDGKPDIQRHAINEKSLFDKSKPNGWAYFYDKARSDLIFVMDSSWDVTRDKALELRGCHVLSEEKFPSYAGEGISPSESLKKLGERMTQLGWKALGGWVASQECALYLQDDDIDKYWIERMKWANEADFAYWKVDNGIKRSDFSFRKRIAELAHEYAPNLVLENACINEIVPYSDVYRTYDVPAIMSIPMTLEKIYNLRSVEAPKKGFECLVNCEDEAYIAAALGFTMGIMRHPYVGAFVNGCEDMSFPSCHRNIKSKLTEVTRAVRWHRIAPAYTFDSRNMLCSDELLFDTWEIQTPNDEIEAWWFDIGAIKDNIKDGILTKSAPSIISRDMPLPQVEGDRIKPYVVASRNPNGAISVATLGRTVKRDYLTPECTVTIDSGDCTTFGVFGYYDKLVLSTTLDTTDLRVLAQDLADDNSYDITDMIEINGGKIAIPGELIRSIGLSAQPDTDTSEPGMIIKLSK